MGLFDTIRRAVGGDDSSTDGDERTAGGDPPSDDGPDLLDTATLDPTTFREYAEHVVGGADPLSFDTAALARLDTAIAENYDGKTAGDAAGPTTYTENTVRFGSYLGELLVRAYDGEWVQSDGRWGVAVAGPNDEVGVAVFDVAARSFADKPVFAAVATRLESELELDVAQGTGDDGGAVDADETDADSVVSEPTRIVSRVDDGQADESDAPPEPTATDERGETTAADTADSDSQAIETEPTRVVRRVEPDSIVDNKSDDTDPTPVVSRVADEPENEASPDHDEADDSVVDAADGAAALDPTDSASDAAGSDPSAAETAGDESTIDSRDAGSTTDTAAEQSADGTADEHPTAETPAEGSALDAMEDGPTAHTTDAVETTADDTVTADEAATYIDEAEPTFDSATADPSDEAPAAETPLEDSAVDSRDENRPVDASAGAATDTSTDEAATDTPDDGAAGASIDDESALDSSLDASSDAAPDAEATPETTGDESPVDTADAAGVDDAPAGVAESDAGELSDDSPDTPAPVEDVEASGATDNAPSQDAAADETAETAATEESENSAPTDGDSTAGSMDRSWESGTVRADHAETAVEFADFWGEHDLDFSPASLSRLDDLVDAEWDGDRFAETTFGSDASFDDRAFTSVVRELGGYFGEVLVRQLDGEWTDETDHEAAVVVGGPAGEFAVPVFEVAITSLRKQAVFGRSYDALLDDLGRDGPTR